MKQNMTTLAAALATTAIVGTAQADLIAADDFSYADGPIAGENGGVGDWDSAWAGGESVVGGAYTSTSASGFTSRVLDTSFSGSTTTPLYFSAKFTKTGPDAGYAFWLQLSDNGISNDNDVTIGMADNTFTARIEGGATNAEARTNFGSVTSGTEYLIVGKLEFNVGGNNERLTVWIDPTGVETAAVTAASPVTQDVGWTTPTHVLAGSIAFNTGTQGQIDDLRIGSTWASVVPEPSSLALLGLGGVLIARRRRA